MIVSKRLFGGEDERTFEDLSSTECRLEKSTYLDILAHMRSSCTHTQAVFMMPHLPNSSVNVHSRSNIS